MVEGGKIYARNALMGPGRVGEDQKGDEEECNEEKLPLGWWSVHCLLLAVFESVPFPLPSESVTTARDFVTSAELCLARVEWMDRSPQRTTDIHPPTARSLRRRRLCPPWQMTLPAWSSNLTLPLLSTLNINAPMTVTLLAAHHATLRTLLPSCSILFSTMKKKETLRTLLLQPLTLCRPKRASNTCLARLRRWLVLPNRLFRPTVSPRAGPLIKTILLFMRHLLLQLLGNPRRLLVENGNGHGRRRRS